MAKFVGKWQRFCAMFYDGCIIVPLLFIASAVAVAVHRSGFEPGNPFLQSYFCVFIATFYLWFWKNRGQTIGMMAWDLQVVNQQGRGLTWSQAILRLSVAVVSNACFGLGWLWCFIDKDNQTLYDRLSKTYLIQR
jgi:uncharacterized RDD family membrane protein YckC